MNGLPDSIIVWNNNSGSSEIAIQVLNATGVKLWPAEKQVNQVTTGSQTHPVVAQEINGSFAVVWADTRNGAGNEDIYGQLLAPDGSPLWGPADIAICTAAEPQK